MWVFTDIADWFTKTQVDADGVLDQMVESSHYSQPVMIAAASAHALTTFGTSFTDLLRIGDGVRHGTFKGAGEDALRFIAIVPWGKFTGLIKTAVGVKEAALIVDTGGPICSWVATTRALAQMGQNINGKIFATIEDLARVTGTNFAELGGIHLVDMLTKLKSIGVKVGELKKLTTSEWTAGISRTAEKDFYALGKKQIASAIMKIQLMLPFNGDVVLISVHVFRKKEFVGNHAIYAFRDTFGRLRFMDRTVAEAKDIYSNLENIGLRYKADMLVPYESAILKNVYAKYVDSTTKLVMPIRAAVGEYSK